MEVGSHSLASPQRQAQSGNSSIHSFLPRGDNEPQEAWAGVTSKVTQTGLALKAPDPSGHPKIEGAALRSE